MTARPLPRLLEDTTAESEGESRRAAQLLVLACALLGAGLATAADGPASRILGFALFVATIALMVRAYLCERHAHLRLHRAYEEAVEERRKFISTVSHDFRSPLTAIVGFTQLLCDQEEALDAERRRGYLRVIREQSQHLGRLIEDTVDLSRLAEGRIVISPVSRPLSNLVEGALALLDHPADRERIRVEIAPEAASVGADQYEFEQVLDRLFASALANSQRGGRLTLQAVVAPAGGARLTLRAEGLDTSAACFQPLSGELAEAIALGKEDQRCLALATARALVELHGGCLWVEEGALALTLGMGSREQGDADPRM
jgi:signal transduction histidine kinase